MEIIDISHSQEIYTISRLNREVRFLLEDNFPLVWVEGEISNFMMAQSGHWYFSLKDNLAQIRCAMFKPQNRRLTFTPKDGMHVIVKARLSLYEGRGDFQLLIEHLEDAGVGKLQKEFEALKKKLSEAGLFNPENKKKLPDYPKCIGVVTSPTGAAIRDILSVLKRRFSCVPVIIYPTLVQGELAAPNIVRALNIANRRNDCDVIILSRGGGSLEDLWPFNEEIVAHAIFNSSIPVISGVGHEIDFTIADFVADVRAPTPSAAAELATSHQDELLEFFENSERHLLRCITHKLEIWKKQLVWTDKHLQQQHPKRRLAEQHQHIDHSEATLIRLQLKFLDALKTRVNTLKEKLLTNNPVHQIRHTRHQLHIQEQGLLTILQRNIQSQTNKLASLAGKLDALSPLATLKRGFAIAIETKNNTILRHASKVTPGDKVQVRLMDGKLECTVDAISS